MLGREQLDVRAFETFDDFVRDADVGNDHLAGVGFARRQHEWQLRRGKRDRERRVDAVADQMRRVCGQTAWQIDRHDRDLRRVHVSDDGLDHSGHGCLESGSEDRIDDQAAL